MDKRTIATLPVGEELLEKLEDRRRKWNHDDFETTLLLLLEVVDFSESKAAEELAGMLGVDVAAQGSTGEGSDASS